MGHGTERGNNGNSIGPEAFALLDVVATNSRGMTAKEVEDH